jgi:transcriptional regulator with XRE-family HTH domain
MSMLFETLQTSDLDHSRGSWRRLFGRFMQGAREAAGRSIEETARLAGMDATEWAAIEAGTRLPDTRQQLQAIAEALEMEWLAMAETVLLCRDAWA